MIKRFKASKTVKSAWAKKALGIVSIILANLGYFESSMTPAAFGALLIIFGILDDHLRDLTNQPIAEKIKNLS